MLSYLILKVLDIQSVSLPSTLLYGSVEFRSYKADFEHEIDALRKSASNLHLDFGKYMYCARIATIVNCDDPLEAVDIADNKFSEILDLKSNEFSISNFKTSGIGFVKNLESGKIQPLNKREHEFSMSFVVQQGSVQCFDLVNYILSLNNELSSRYLRSLHWARNSKHENNRQLKILFYWFSIEALIKESENDNISGVIRWFLGFPNGRKRNDVSTLVLGNLSQNPRYDYWNKELITIVDKIRIFRNDSVHSGFRSVDFTKHDLDLYNQVMIFSASRCQTAVQTALVNRISTVSEFKEYMGIIFEDNMNLINDVHRNIIFSLDRIRSA